jgi:L-aspartate oxidase
VPDGPAAPAPLAPDRLADVMWREVGVFRDAASLRRALDVLEPAWAEAAGAIALGRSGSPDTWRARSLVAVARLIARSALRREESRGSHWRRDFPEKDDLHWKRHLTELRSPGFEVRS